MSIFPIVSIIIPTYNRQRLVSETLDSVLTQTSNKWECIVVDDGSTDNTWNVLEQYAAKDSRIKILKRNREPKGAGTCRNIGVENSQGNYLFFFDSDDLLMPWAIGERLTFIENNQGFDFYLSQGLNFFKDGKIALRGNPKENDYIKAFITFQTAFQTPAPTWEKDFFKSTGGWNESLARWQDPDIHIRALLKKPKLKWISEVPDHLIRYDNIDSNKITDLSKAFDNFSSGIKGYGSILKLLNSEYQSIFKYYVVNQAWHFSCNLSLSQINSVSSELYKQNFMSSADAENYYKLCKNYFKVRKIPLLRKIAYNAIHKNTVSLETYKRYEDKNAIETFMEKLNSLQEVEPFIRKIKTIINN